MDASKRSIEVTYQGRSVRVAWYPNTGDAALERALHQALELAEGHRVRLRDPDGDIVALTAALPAGLKLAAELVAARAPAHLSPVPGPRPYPIVGNIPQIGKPDEFYETTEALLREYGSFVRLRFPGSTLYLCTDADAVSDLLARPDDFPKLVKGDRSPLGHLREHAVGDGLFTADDTEESWHVAHRVLLPALGARALKQYYPKMLELTDEMFERLDRPGGDGTFLATDVMTRMTFETIAYTGFDTRFNCLADDELPGYVQAMVDVLIDAQASPTTILPSVFHPIATRRRDKAAGVLRDTVDHIVAERRATLERGEAVPNDMLQAMLATRDRVTGTKLSDENIRHQLNTLLIAGHETTSGLLSYALYYIASHPEVEARLVAEVDRTLGRDHSYQPTIQDIERLEYTGRVLMEALRLNPTAPAFQKHVVKDTVVAGRYPVNKGARILVMLRPLHRDRRYWGDRAEEFDPDRFLPEAVAARHPNAYHPFGLGMRSCIGFQFALLEARLVLARLYQRSLPRLVDPKYRLRHVPTLTLKPADLFMCLERRPEDRSVRPASQTTAAARARPEAERANVGAAGDLLVLYGSNMGASQELALELARQAEQYGRAATVAELDAWAGRLSSGSTVVIVCSTYNGLPPDNAQRFAAWIDDPARGPKSLDGVDFAVLGCGNTQWRGTYQRFPKHLQQRLTALGARALVEPGACDADGDFERAAEAWSATLWAALQQGSGTARASLVPVDDRLYTVEVSNFAGAGAGVDATLPSAWPLHDAARFARVLRNDELQTPGSGRSTRHIEIALAEGLTYQAGDHLGVFPENPSDSVEAAAERCGLRLSDVVVLREREGASSAEAGRLPTGVPVSVRDLLARYIDLLGPVSRRELRVFSRRSQCPPERDALEAMTTDEGYRTTVLEARPTVLDVLDRYRSVTMDLSLLLSLRPLLKPRYYSISSSSRTAPTVCSLTVGVHAFTTSNGRRHEGVGSHYLASQEPGSSVRTLVKDTGSTFRLPSDPTRDVILIGPGTGLAPLRGFIQERAAQRAAGLSVGQTHLYFGCRGPSHDYLYRSELEAWLSDRTLSGLHLAFSREPGVTKTYVQDVLRARAAEVASLLRGGAHVFVCGDARAMALAVGEALEEVVGREGFEALKADGRYQQDVWAS